MNGKRRPKAAPETVPTTTPSVPPDLHRRREASRRLPTMCGSHRRDPLDPPRVRLPITVRAIGAQTVEFTGSDQAVFGAIKTLGVRYYQRATRGRAWLLRQQEAEDVMAFLESRGFHFEAQL